MAEDPRFAMLVTIRDYAHERLTASDEFDGLSMRHAHVYLEFVERMAPALTGRDARSVSDRYELDHDNIRAALDWCVAHGEVEMAMRLVVSTWRFWQRRGHLVEARRRADAVLAMPGVDDQPAVLRAGTLQRGGQHRVLAGGRTRLVSLLHRGDSKRPRSRATSD